MSLPPNQQLVAPGKWPVVGERAPREDSAPWTVTVSGLVNSERTFRLSELFRLGGGEPYEQTVDIHCVTRWSKLNVQFGGILLQSVLNECGIQPQARFVRMVARSERDHSTSLPLQDALDLNTLIAFSCEGKPLETIHGGPVRTVVSGRYFYKSLKWLERIELLAEDKPGYWESETGYHNRADPWLEQRYAVPNLDRRDVRALLSTRNFSGRDLRSIQAAHLDLAGLQALDAALRDADFRRAILRNAVFDGANLSNAHFQQADLRFASFRPTDRQQADLEGADFRGADLRGAVFEQVSLFGATFAARSQDADFGSALIDQTTRFDETSLATLEATPIQEEYIRRQSASR